jgi:hypothetical protein
MTEPKEFELTIDTEAVLKSGQIHVIELTEQRNGEGGEAAYVEVTAADVVTMANHLETAQARVEEIEKELGDVRHSLHRSNQASETYRLELVKAIGVINRIAGQVGHPPIAEGELGIESVAEYLERRLEYAQEREETLDSITPENLQAFAASEAHHDEHHEREAELQTQLAAKETTIADLRDLAYERQPKIAAEELRKQREEFEGQLAYAAGLKDGYEFRATTAEAQLAEANAKLERSWSGREIARLKGELEIAWGQSEAAEAERDAAFKSAEIQLEACNKAEAQAATFKAALEQVEWTTHTIAYFKLRCPWCENYKEHDHKPTCARQATLAPKEREGEGERKTDKERLDFLSRHMAQVSLDYHCPKGEAFLYSGKKTLREVVDIEMARRAAAETRAEGVKNED